MHWLMLPMYVGLVCDPGSVLCAVAQLGGRAEPAGPAAGVITNMICCPTTGAPARRCGRGPAGSDGARLDGSDAVVAAAAAGQPNSRRGRWSQTRDTPGCRMHAGGQPHPQLPGAVVALPNHSSRLARGHDPALRSPAQGRLRTTSSPEGWRRRRPLRRACPCCSSR